MADYNYMSQEGFDKLREELKALKTIKRREIAQQIREAREKGDLSENAEYHAAKEAQGHLEMKIRKLEDTLSKARVMETGSLDGSRVTVLSRVEISMVTTGKKFSYTIVSAEEADIKLGKLSKDSPIGKGLLGAITGEIVTIQTPSGTQEFKVLSITI